MINTLQPIKFDPYVCANCTKDEYVLSNYGGLPNESMLEEQWENLPEARDDAPLRHWHTLLKSIFKPGVPIRFYLNRLEDICGVSKTGKILNGVVMPSGKVLIEWRHPHPTVGVYDNFSQFLDIHVEFMPQANEVVFID